MGLNSGSTRVAELTFRVFTRPVHPDFFEVRAFRRIQQPGWEADLRLIHGGHAIHWCCGRTRITEVLSGAETDLPDEFQPIRAPVRNEKSVTLQAPAGPSYQACFAVERLDAEVFAHLTDELLLHDPRTTLLMRPRPVNRMAPAPLSLIQFEATAGRLGIQTFHTFPDERAIVRTQSLYELEEPSGPFWV